MTNGLVKVLHILNYGLGKELHLLNGLGKELSLNGCLVSNGLGRKGPLMNGLVMGLAL